MYVLGIESSCDETAAAVVEDGRHSLSGVVASQVEEHKLYGGVVPEIAGRRHAEAISAVVREALQRAGLTMADIDAVAVTYAPGLIGALLVGLNFAKGLAFSSGKPLVPVHHLRSHMAANYLAHPDLKPPYLGMIVSGGHSHIVRVDDYTGYTVIGRTRDDAAGECFDKCGRAMGLPYPGGIHLDELAEQGDPHAFRLPRPKVDGSRFDFSFSGLKTAVLNQLHHAEQVGETVNHADLAASLRYTVTDMLVERLMLAADECRAEAVVVAGGVSANRELRRRLTEVCEQTGRALYLPPKNLCGDNAEMVAAQGYYEWQAGHIAGMNLNAVAARSIELNHND